MTVNEGNRISPGTSLENLRRGKDISMQGALLRGQTFKPFPFVVEGKGVWKKGWRFVPGRVLRQQCLGRNSYIEV